MFFSIEIANTAKLGPEKTASEVKQLVSYRKVMKKSSDLKYVWTDGVTLSQILRLPPVILVFQSLFSSRIWTKMCLFYVLFLQWICCSRCIRSTWVFSAKAQMSREFVLFENLVCCLFYCFSTHFFFIFYFIIIYYSFCAHKTSVCTVALIFRSLDDYLDAVKWRTT